MTSDDLANLLVDHFNELADKPQQFVASNPEIVDVTAKSDFWSVWVQPYAESEEPRDRGDMCREGLVCNVIVHGPITDGSDKPAGIAFVKFLRSSLKETTLGGYRWAGNETVSLFDFEDLKTKRMFVSLFRAEYFSFE